MQRDPLTAFQERGRRSSRTFGAAARRLGATGGLLFALVVRLVPYHLRFRFAFIFATTWSVLPTRERRRGEKSYFGTATRREALLYRVLQHLTRNGTAFAIPARVHNEALLDRALTSADGVLVVATHAILNLLLLRYFVDGGHDPVVVAAEESMAVMGSPRILHTLVPSEATFLRVRRNLLSGRLICTMIDRRSRIPRRSTPLITGSGTIHVTDGLFRLASKCGARSCSFTPTCRRKESSPSACRYTMAQHQQRP